MLRYQQQFSFFDVDKINNSIRFLNLAKEMSSGNFDHVLERIVHEVHEYSAGLVFVDSFRSVVSIAQGKGVGDTELQNFVQRLGVFLTSWQATTFLVGEYEGGDTGSNPVFTVADGILMMNQTVQQNSSVRKIRVSKMRGQAALSGLHSFRISPAGIEVFPRVLSEAQVDRAAARHENVDEPRLSMGNADLDAMMGGGLPAGHSLLISGPSGSGKTTLSTMFLAAGARNGEKGIAGHLRTRT